MFCFPTCVLGIPNLVGKKGMDFGAGSAGFEEWGGEMRGNTEGYGWAIILVTWGWLVENLPIEDRVT